MLLKACLQSVVIRIGTRLEQVNVIKARIRPGHEWQSRWQDTRLRLVDIPSRQQLGPFRTYISHFHHTVAGELPFDVEIPMLHVPRAQVTLNSERGVRQRKREERWKRIVHRQRQARQREEDVVIE